MAISFKHYYKSGSLIGTGAVKFRPYTVASPLPQLATPQNVTADGTVVSWDEVENATSYDVLADGTSIGEVDATPTPTLISFTIYTDSYQAEDGMTWGEWVASSYNTDGYSILDNYVFISEHIVSYEGNPVISADIIIANAEYSHRFYEGSGVPK